MKIKQVEELVGITSKNIRFYEDQGLVNPARAENGYREYGLEDIKRLKQIKLFRKLGVPVEDIKNLFEGKQDLDSCLENNLKLLEKEQQDNLNRQELTKNMIDAGSSIEILDSDLWLEQIESMEKEGIDFVDLNKIDIHMKKKAGAIGGGVAAIIIMALMCVLIVVCTLLDPDTPKLFVGLVFGLNVIGIIGVIVAIISRLKEIDGGEEDEALKY